MQSALPRLAFRLVLIVLLIAGNLWLALWLRDFAAEMAAQGRIELFGATVAGLLLLYALVLAIPFVPGAEIGLALLMTHGASAAPFVGRDGSGAELCLRGGPRPVGTPHLRGAGAARFCPRGGDAGPVAGNRPRNPDTAA